MPGRTLFRYTKEEVAKHNTPSNLWVIVKDKVYDVTEFAVDHPGGAELIEKWAGKDVSDMLTDSTSHVHSEVAYEVLSDLCIGELVGAVGSQLRLANGNSKTNLPWSEDENVFLADGSSNFQPVDTDVKSDFQKERFLNLSKPLIYQMLHCKFSKEFYLTQVHKPRHLPHPARLFANPMLELLTRTPWYVIPIVWLPGVLYHMYLASLEFDQTSVAMWFFVGVSTWTLLEYTLHRFLFHVDKLLPDHPYALTLHFLLHGIHHYLPMDKLRLVMPPVLGISIAFPILTLTNIIFPEGVAQALISGMIFGYICYDMTHYHLHHAQPFGEHLKEMKTYHLAHHYKNFEVGYGITSKLWDRLFGTLLIYS